MQKIKTVNTTNLLVTAISDYARTEGECKVAGNSSSLRVILTKLLYVYQLKGSTFVQVSMWRKIKKRDWDTHKNESSWIVRRSGDRHGSMDSPHRKHVCIVHRSARTTRGCAVLPHAARDASVGASAVKCIVNGPHFAQPPSWRRRSTKKKQLNPAKITLMRHTAAASWITRTRESPSCSHFYAHNSGD